MCGIERRPYCVTDHLLNENKKLIRFTSYQNQTIDYNYREKNRCFCCCFFKLATYFLFVYVIYAHINKNDHHLFTINLRKYWNHPTHVFKPLYSTFPLYCKYGIYYITYYNTLAENVILRNKIIKMKDVFALIHTCTKYSFSNIKQSQRNLVLLIFFPFIC